MALPFDAAFGENFGVLEPTAGLPGAQAGGQAPAAAPTGQQFNFERNLPLAIGFALERGGNALRGLPPPRDPFKAMRDEDRRREEFNLRKIAFGFNAASKIFQLGQNVAPEKRSEFFKKQFAAIPKNAFGEGFGEFMEQLSTTEFAANIGKFRAPFTARRNGKLGKLFVNPESGKEVFIPTGAVEGSGPVGVRIVKRPNGTSDLITFNKKTGNLIGKGQSLGKTLVKGETLTEFQRETLALREKQIGETGKLRRETREQTAEFRRESLKLSKQSLALRKDANKRQRQKESRAAIGLDPRTVRETTAQNKEIDNLLTGAGGLLEASRSLGGESSLGEKFIKEPTGVGREIVKLFGGNPKQITQDRQLFRLFRERLIAAMGKSGRIPVQEQRRIIELLPSDGIFENTQRAREALEAVLNGLRRIRQDNTEFLSGKTSGPQGGGGAAGLPSGVPSGSSLVGKSKQGKDVYRTPDGKFLEVQ